MRLPIITLVAAFFAVLIITFVAAVAFAADNVKQPLQVGWAFDGALGHVDRQAAQRGFQVYKQVCSSCHGMKYKSYRNLSDIGFSEAEIKAIAAEYNMTDGPDDTGDMFERPAKPSDAFVSPFPNEQAARAANGGAYPVDLSLITKARVHGPDYVYSLLTGYSEAPAGVELMSGMYYNPYFPGGQLAMTPPLSEGAVEYMDGTEASVDQMAYDVVNFLQWAAEPEMEARKRMGIKVLLFMSVFTILFVVAKRRVWANVK